MDISEVISLLENCCGRLGQRGDSILDRIKRYNLVLVPKDTYEMLLNKADLFDAIEEIRKEKTNG